MPISASTLRGHGHAHVKSKALNLFLEHNHLKEFSLHALALLKLVLGNQRRDTSKQRGPPLPTSRQGLLALGQDKKGGVFCFFLAPWDIISRELFRFDAVNEIKSPTVIFVKISCRLFSFMLIIKTNQKVANSNFSLG